MRSVSNFQLLMAGVLVSVLFLINLALQVYDPMRAVLVGLCAAFVVSLIFRFIEKRLQHNEHSWLQRDVSSKLGGRVITCVVILWLLGVSTIFVIFMAIGSNSPFMVTILALCTIGGIAMGRYIQIKYRMANLLPYGISFTVALIVLLCVLATIHH